MGLCHKCGMILADDVVFAGTHKCKAADIPLPGQEKKPTTTNVDPTAA